MHNEQTIKRHRGLMKGILAKRNPSLRRWFGPDRKTTHSITTLGPFGPDNEL